MKSLITTAPLVTKSSRFFLCLAAAVVAIIGSAAASHASSIIIKPTGATAVSAPGGGTQYQSINNIFNGNGLSSDLITGDPVPLTGFWPTHSTAQNTQWVADGNNGTNPLTWTVTLTLGGAYTLSGFHLWNENELDAGRSAKDYTVSYSSDNSLYTSTTAAPTPFLAGPNSGSYQGDDYSFTSPVAASYVRFVITDGYSGSGPGSFVGLSEIRFTEATPEPASLGLLAIGGLALLKRRR